MIFKRVGEGRPYPDHGLTSRGWAEVPPRQVRLDELVTTKDTLQLATLLDEDSTFYGDLFAHVVEWRGEYYLEDGLHRALRAALQQRNVLHARVHAVAGLMQQAAKTAATLSVLCVLLVIVGRLGRSTPPPSRSPARPSRRCASSTAIDAGERVFPQQVTVSVYNASDRNGLAGRTHRPVRRRRLRRRA